MKSLIIIDAGHGKETAGKRSPVWKDGKQLFEWQFNREIAKLLKAKIESMGIFDVLYINEKDLEKDIALGDRCKIANAAFKGRTAVFISIHGNAAGVESAKGLEVFTSVGQTTSDQFAEIVINRLRMLMPDRKFRMDTLDGDSDKEEGFYVLNATKMPAILIEFGFYTNEEECHLMLTDKFKKTCVDAVINALAEAKEKGLLV